MPHDTTPSIEPSPPNSPDHASQNERELIHTLYDAFNQRDANTLLRHLGADVDWPAWPDTEARLQGRAAVKAYWREQWEGKRHATDAITAVDRLPDGRWAVRLDQVVRDTDGSVLSRSRFEHRLRIEDSLVRRLDIHPV